MVVGSSPEELFQGVQLLKETISIIGIISILITLWVHNIVPTAKLFIGPMVCDPLPWHRLARAMICGSS